ncbi:glycosyltransferase, partial [Microbacterium sp. Leaf351]|uniref:glycosyltransferase n=1 Tax=Microbacterium sp. Leaf351 TaxID=1736348 RepID=UPI001F3661AD
MADTTETSFDIPLDAYRDGGWIWFDVIAQSEMEIDGAEWTSDIEPPRDGRASIGVTTYNKPAYCVKTLRQIADAPDLRDLVDRIFLVDQGTDAVTDATGFDEVATALSDQLVVITQPNLGGSGGFARTMIESLSRPETAFVQLLDDDVLIEPESVRRSIMFARFASRPTIVGGHMFDLLNRPVLHAWAEVVESAPFMWRNLYQEQFPHDFS